jgi:hypothetical protein
MDSYRSSDQMFIGGLLNEQPLSVFTIVKIAIQIACILPAKHHLGLGASAIVFYDLTLA